MGTTGNLYIADTNNGASARSRPRAARAGGRGPASLTVTANNASKICGSADPPFSVTETGFVNGDTSANLGGTLVFTTTEPAHGVALAGTYQIMPCGWTSANYAITYLHGTLTINPGPPDHLGFGQQPTITAPGSVLSPFLTVDVLDQYGNLVTTDNSDQVNINLGANPGDGTLTGTGTRTVSGGVATFNDLSINQPGSGYTLAASFGTMNVTSANFTIGTGTVEGFETPVAYALFGATKPTASTSTLAAHDGSYGLLMTSASDWMYRGDSSGYVQAGDTMSVWMDFPILADGRAYLTFGSSSTGTLSLVAAPNTNQFVLQNNSGWGFVNLAAAPQTWLTNHWYRLEVDWWTNGTIVGQLFDSNGTTQLNSVTGSTTAITSGGIGFRAISGSVYWDTLQVTPGANQSASGGTASPAASSAIAARRRADQRSLHPDHRLPPHRQSLPRRHDLASRRRLVRTAGKLRGGLRPGHHHGKHVEGHRRGHDHRGGRAAGQRGLYGSGILRLVPRNETRRSRGEPVVAKRSDRDCLWRDRQPRGDLDQRRHGDPRRNDHLQPRRLQVGTAVTDANGLATLSGVGLAGISVGSYTAFVGAASRATPLIPRQHSRRSGGDCRAADDHRQRRRKTYGAADPTFSVSYAGFVSGEGRAISAAL